MVKTFVQWKEDLLPREIEALEDNYVQPGDKLSANDVFEYIVSWEGGLASAYHIKSLISRVYGVELGRE